MSGVSTRIFALLEELLAVCAMICLEMYNLQYLQQKTLGSGKILQARPIPMGYVHILYSRNFG